jgi:hypothetical protein
MSAVPLRLKIQAKSSTATILAIVAAVAALGVGLGIFGTNIEGIIIAATSDGVIVAGLIANAIHTDSIEPSGLLTAVLAFVGQVVALLVSFSLITNAEASHVVAIAAAVVLAGVTIAHALLSKQVSA